MVSNYLLYFYISSVVIIVCGLIVLNTWQENISEEIPKPMYMSRKYPNKENISDEIPKPMYMSHKYPNMYIYVYV